MKLLNNIHKMETIKEIEEIEEIEEKKIIKKNEINYDSEKKHPKIIYVKRENIIILHDKETSLNYNKKKNIKKQIENDYEKNNTYIENFIETDYL